MKVDRRWLIVLCVVGMLTPYLMAVAPIKRQAQVIESGTAVLNFNNQNTAIIQIEFVNAYNGQPTVVCSASNEWESGVLVGCQSLTNTFGVVSAQLPYTTPLTLEVNWIAIGDVVR